MKYAVLGGGGFIGSHLTESLLMLGHDVTILDRPQARYLARAKRAGAKIVKGDFLNIYDLKKTIAGAEVVYHLISTTVPQTATNDPLFDAETNLLGTVKLLQEAKKAQVRRIIFTSSGGTVYGIPQKVPITEDHPTEPIGAYGISKLTIEKYLHLYWTLYEVQYCVLRVANAYGERQPIKESQGVIPAFLDKIMHDEPLEIWGDGSVIRDYVHVNDIVNALLKSALYREPTGIFNIGAGRGHSLNELIEIMKNVIGKSIRVNYASGRTFDVPVNILDISHAKAQLVWEPIIGIEMGIGRMFEWMLARQHQDK